VRFAWGIWLIIAVALLGAAGVFGVLAVRQAGEISAYHHASKCLAGARPDADCLQPVTGTVTGVTDVGGKIAEYVLGVQTATGRLHITFTSDGPMLGHAVDGDPAVVTMWRGIPVSVTADGRAEATATVPDTAFAQNLGECAAAGGLGVFLVLIVGQRRKPLGPQYMRAHPSVAVGVLALIFGGLVIMGGGLFLLGQPSALVPDLVISGAALLAVVGVCAWLRITVSSRARRHLAAGGPGAQGRR
jgi:hypothetical protein